MDLLLAQGFFLSEDADEQLLHIDLRVLRRDGLGDVHQVDDVIEQAALISVVVLDTCRRAAELVHEDIVGEVRLDERRQRL